MTKIAKRFQISVQYQDNFEMSGISVNSGQLRPLSLLINSISQLYCTRFTFLLLRTLLLVQAEQPISYVCVCASD